MADMQKKSGQQPLQTGNTTPPGNTHVDAKIKTFTVHIFFDGTGNNRFNTKIYRENKKNAPKGSVSYENYYSNVALLFMAMQETPTVRKIYIEGAGTNKGKKDSEVFGMGLAISNTGREDRVNEALKNLKAITKNIAPDIVVINVYGFSRGAAWARNFCYLFKSPKSKWKKSKINFVGIFDTVSSDQLSVYNDVQELGLDIGKPQGINYIAHLTAQNDYRHNFPLTRIRGALKDGIGFECSFPGAHSDIGGGYSEKASEKKMLSLINDPLLANKLKDEYISYKWFLDKGYYNESQFKQNHAQVQKNGMGNNFDMNYMSQGVGRGIGITSKEYGERTVYFHYQFVVGSIMFEIAKRKAQYVLLLGTDLEKGVNSMKTIDVLNRFYNGAFNYVMEKMAVKGGGYAVPLLNKTDMQKLYNLFIHNSLTYGDIANKGTLLNKIQKNDYCKPKRPEVTQGFR